MPEPGGRVGPRGHAGDAVKHHRFAPDGHLKRRARKGEERCGACKHYFAAWKSSGYYGMDTDGVMRWFRGRKVPANCEGLPCRADDAACGAIERRPR